MELLIPEAWFRGMPQWQLLLVATVAIAVLGRGADWLVEGASGLAYRIGISRIIVGATVVSLGTTSPECAVSVLAAWSGESGLALGNAIGSIIADTGLIFGIGCLATALPADRFVLSRQGWVQFGSGLLLCVLCYGAYVLSPGSPVLGRPVGALLLALLVIYLVMSVRWSRRHPAGEPFQMDDEAAADRGTHEPMSGLVGFGLLGLLLVIASSRVLIVAVSEVAEVHWHVPKIVIAGTLVALGTSLPELVIGVTSILKGHAEILVGNVIGADILNVLFVVGAAAMAAPLPVIEEGARIPELALYVHLPAMLAVLVLFRIFIRAAVRRGNFRRWYGVPLLGLYVGYVIVQYVVS